MKEFCSRQGLWHAETKEALIAILRVAAAKYGNLELSDSELQGAINACRRQNVVLPRQAAQSAVLCLEIVDELGG